LQSPAPTLVLYFPALHATHATPSLAAAYPALQEQFVASVLPLKEKVLSKHRAQLLSAVAAGKTRYLPATQLMHGVFSSDCLYVPGGQALQPSPGVTLQAAASGIE
jgi:histidinol dehydrogenase